MSAGGGTTINGDDYARALAVDSFGNAYVAGTYTSSVAFFGTIQLPNPNVTGRSLVFIAKLDLAGRWEWVRRNEPTQTGDDVRALCADAAGGVYLALMAALGTQFGPLVAVDAPNSCGGVVVKLDATGAWQWLAHARSSRNANVSCNELVLGRFGELYVTGTFDGDTATVGSTQLFNTGPFPPMPPHGNPFWHTSNAFMARLDARTGAWRWAVQTRGDGAESFSPPLADGAGLLYTGVQVYAPTFPYGPVTPHYQVGPTAVFMAGQGDIVAAQLDTAGAWRWVAQAGSAAQEWATPRYFDAQGRVVLQGQFEGSSLQLGATTLMAAPTAGYFVTATAFATTLRPGTPLAAAAPRPVAFAVYPNPARGRVTVAGAPARQPVQVLDALGRRVAAGVMPGRGPLELALPPNLPAGVYIVRAGQLSRRLIVE